MNIYERSYKIFKPIVGNFKHLFEPLNKKLKIAHISTNAKHYIAFSLLMGLIIFILSLAFISVIGTLFLGFKIIMLLIYVMLSFFIATATTVFTYLYPSFIISEKKNQMENALPFVTIYLSTVVRSGFPPHKMFELLSRFKDYKMVSKEARKINSDIKGLNTDLPDALSGAMNRSASPNWTELLVGLRNSITVGGDIGKFLQEKSKSFIEIYKRNLAEFSNLLSLMMNMYITVVIVGIIFFIVISSLMITVGGVSVELTKLIQYSLVFIGLPLITAIFIITLKSQSPWSG